MKKGDDTKEKEGNEGGSDNKSEGDEEDMNNNNEGKLTEKMKEGGGESVGGDGEYESDEDIVENHKDEEVFEENKKDNRDNYSILEEKNMENKDAKYSELMAQIRKLEKDKKDLVGLTEVLKNKGTIKKKSRKKATAIDLKEILES